ncbi:HNH endonuclease [Oceanihabitans sediminis]|uniref:HNH endonuclease n=1 Tax=Oceanihabitans sediminis TaxID=1812012 RepID=A0A368P4U5_9FLAO|nr:HNH endonuclease domain-containing protein [Oceanihabitans sediminis]RBP34217.1 HNH endonuclease [Oceanihabitans sediminis]RCU57907.1 HNH endonuclease [Oceanihabitans sediminis]
MTKFQINDPSLESQWRALILFGKNSATYKFAFAKSLLELIDNETTKISLSDLSKPFSKNIIEHLKQNDKQGNSKSSSFLDVCRDHIKGEVTDEELWHKTEKLGFNNVVDAFQNINGGQIPDLFYEKNYKGGNKEIIIKDNLLKLKESFHFQNFDQEVEARWNLVETAWNLNLNPKLLEVKYDEEKSLFFLENSLMRRTDITSVRDSLNGYQKGKCFYSFQDISVVSGSENLCDVDHFLPHLNKSFHNELGANIDGVWNLVLADKNVNRNKSARIPERRFLERLYNRNEFYIESKHPLAETIINQTGSTKKKRIDFLNKQYQIALNSAIITWKPEIELKGNF